jgi:chemotaxis protein MotB
MFTLARRGRHSVNVWPAFVDGLASILLVLVFMLLIFVLGQFLLGTQLAGRERALEELSRQVSALAETLALERASGQALRARLLATLADLDVRTAEAGAAHENVDLLSQQVQALRDQISALSRALDVSEAKAAAQQEEIAQLGNRLNLALAKRAEELERYRSEFFGRLRTVLGDNPNIRIVGDRFVFQSELLFPTGEARLAPEGERRLAQLAKTLGGVTKHIPADIDWVLQVAGHTDRRPISTPQFPSNWELSTARALSVVHFLASQGIPAQHLSAAGFGEHYPVDPGDGEAAWARNRRIEIKLTQP